MLDHEYYCTRGNTVSTYYRAYCPQFKRAAEYVSTLCVMGCDKAKVEVLRTLRTKVSASTRKQCLIAFKQMPRLTEDQPFQMFHENTTFSRTDSFAVFSFCTINITAHHLIKGYRGAILKIRLIKNRQAKYCVSIFAISSEPQRMRFRLFEIKLVLQTNDLLKKELVTIPCSSSETGPALSLTSKSEFKMYI
ncbi:hypothetical protein ACU8KH_02204 [Lachancea thermotolerans]